MYRATHRNFFASMFCSLTVCTALMFALAGCGGGSGGPVAAPPPPPPPPAPQFLTQADVSAVVQAAATAAQSDTMAIAVVDRLGRILAVYKGPSAPRSVAGNFGAMVPAGDFAVSLARTGAFFSNDQAPLSSRTVRFISGVHFPPGVMNAPNAALYGIENTNRGCTLSPGLSATIPPATTIAGASPGFGVATGKADTMDSDPTAVNPGGVPIFKNGDVVGGIGITGVDPLTAEYAAFTAMQINVDGVGLDLATLPPPGEVVIDGIALPFVNQTTAPASTTPGTFNAANFTVGPVASPGDAPDGYLIPPTAGPIGGLTAAQVTGIITNAIDTANVTRALIRLPLGSRARMSVAVSDLDGTIIGLYRMTDGTVFSIDVAATKARNVIYFSGPARQPQDANQVPMGTAVTNRTIGFGAQPFFPPGHQRLASRPLLQSLYPGHRAIPAPRAFQIPGPLARGESKRASCSSPGSEPLYMNGQLVGGLGVSGDGVDQDDYVTSGGAVGFEAPTSIQADQIMIDGVRLPYLHFPRNPTQ